MRLPRPGRDNERDLRALGQLHGSLTVVIITHRLAAAGVIRCAMEEGRIVASGTPEVLSVNRLLTEHFSYLGRRELRQWQGDRGGRPRGRRRARHWLRQRRAGPCLRAGASCARDQELRLSVARRTMAQAGLKRHASFYRERSQQVELPERVDVVVCDHVGYFGIDYGILGMLADAGRRFLKPAGTIIPAELQLSVAAVESEPCRELVGRWRKEHVPADYHWLGEIATDTKHPVTLKAEELLSAAAKVATVVPGQTFKLLLVDATPPPGTGADGGGWLGCRLAADVVMTKAAAFGCNGRRYSCRR
jgi:hypothetical protein